MIAFATATRYESRLPWNRHRERWGACKRCPLHKHRGSVVLYRGWIPCEFLLVGEAPGESENVVGLPFVGPAGHLLESMLEIVFQKIGFRRHGITNIIACIPQKPDDLSSGMIRPPTSAEAEACRERLVDIIRVTKPRLIVTLGRVAEKYLPPVQVPDLALIHPAAILRQPEGTRGLAVKRFTVNLITALEKIPDLK